MQTLTRLNERTDEVRAWSDRYFKPVILLLVRLVVARVFLMSGWLKFGYVRNHDIDTLYFLFQDYMVPFLTVPQAAWMGMSGELGFSLLLGLGLFGRVGALGLIFMSGVIFHTDHNMSAPYWAILCAVILAMGPGALSADGLIWGRLLRRRGSTDRDSANPGTSAH